MVLQQTVIVSRFKTSLILCVINRFQYRQIVGIRLGYRLTVEIGKNYFTVTGKGAN